MQVWGITGSIGMGKTTVAGQFSDSGVPVFCSDEAVHQLMGPGGLAVDALSEIFPEAREEDHINRALLSAQIAGKPEMFAQLEAILHPLVRQMQQAFIIFYQRQRHHMPVMLDIPLLFETGAEQRLDRVVVVDAPAWLQKQRVMARAGMTEAKFRAIVSRQMPNWQKCAMADWVVHTGLGKAHSLREVAHILRREGF